MCAFKQSEKGMEFSMKKIIKKITTIIIIILFLVAFSSSYSSLNIANLDYVVAIGFDTSTSNNFCISFQFAKVASVSESGTTEQTPTIINTVEASSLNNAIDLMNTYIGKKLNLSHCKAIVFSEEIATKGISDQIYTLINDTQIRPSANIIVSKCSAQYYIENSKPIFENLITKYYEISPSSSEYTGYTSDSTIGDFFNSIECGTCEPTAILGGLNTKSSDNNSTLNDKKDSSTESNESSISGKRGTENIGVAVFKGDKLIGELNASECLAFLNIRNEVKGFYVTVPDPENSQNNIDIYLTPNENTKISVDIVNGSPYVKVKASYSGRIHSLTSNSRYLDEDVLNNISDACNKYLETVLSDYLYKTSKDFKSDINGIGKFALSKFLTSKDYTNYNWLENYKNAFFNVDVNTSIKSSLLITET